MDNEDPNEAVAQSLPEQVQALSAEALEFGATFVTLGWRLYQVLLILLLIAIAYGIEYLTRQNVREWLRARRGWRKWQLRLSLILHKRMRLILFVVMIWALIFFMQEVTWYSRTYVLRIVASIATAWLVVSLAARVIHNRLLRRIVVWSAWIYVTLHFTGALDSISSLLDSVAINTGEARLSLLDVIKAFVILAALLAVVRLIARMSASRIKSNDDISPSMQVLFVKAMQVLLYGAAFFFGLKAVGFDLTGLAVLSGAIGVGLGFGLQKVVSNLVSGVIILLDKSIKPGDVISLGETFGWINALGARYVSVVTRNGKEYLIPNEDLITGQVVNWSHSDAYVRLDIFFGTAYTDDPHQVRQIACEAAGRVQRVLTRTHTPVCHIVGFGDSSVDYILRFWISDPTRGLTNVRGSVYLALWDAFKEHGISIPFPQREVRVLNDPQDGVSAVEPISPPSKGASD
ncbi:MULTISPECIES: mechanosensitive ion channel family protein [Halocynthiibacter]|uniref:Mechanosensitive ion channel n=1 Tax=Halocynthiibacter halioticoli TaxID=2986804 RepID=A0AAE3IWU0_9RHOB|nr:MULTISPECIES: mechanosensitive ion channel domain-containing protein [Halocynthiibacter]MCV6823174.1 mechanosensitive ion channel [Halocynthiibacter halioticoli]MCW4056175.1 mechanosensitive ion channel [Halocynthiibacter sp. SDUM655004]